MNKHFVGLALILILLSIGAAQITFSARPQQSEFQRSINQKTGKATSVQEGVMTEKQKKHSKIFRGFESYTQGKKLRDLTSETWDVYLVVPVGNVITPRSFNLTEFLRNMSCEADAVVIGKVQGKVSQIIEEGTFIFTDYELTVSEILKDDDAAPIEVNANITYTSPGGAIELNGRTIRAVDQRREPLQIGERYLLYLKRIPEMSTYKGFSNSRDGDSFQIKDGIITQASNRLLPLGTKRTTTADYFMAEVRAALYQGANNF
ncbi:MAG TPA: hypothetical protein VF528_19165 [Pyrinomonadaceae bacterium]|jgi:hypothetical protein